MSGGGASRPLPSETRTWASAARQGHAPHWPPPRPDRPLAPEFQKERELLLRALRVWSSPRWAQRDSGLPWATAPGPLMPPRELLARPGGGRGAGKNPRGRRAGLGVGTVWGLEGSSRCGRGVKQSPPWEARHPTLTPCPRLGAGRPTPGAQARAGPPPPPEPALSLGRASQARCPPRRHEDQVGRRGSLAPPQKPKERGRGVTPRRGPPPRIRRALEPQLCQQPRRGPAGSQVFGSGQPTPLRLLLSREGPRLRRRREGTVANSCSSYIFHYTIR